MDSLLRALISFAAPLFAAGSPAPRQEELLFTQTALLSRTTHISRRYAIKHADPKCHKQVLRKGLVADTDAAAAHVHQRSGPTICRCGAKASRSSARRQRCCR